MNLAQSDETSGAAERKMLSYLKRQGINSLEGLKAKLTSVYYPTFAIIMTSNGRSVDDFKRYLERVGADISAGALDRLHHDDFKKSLVWNPDQVELCETTLRELTGRESATLKEVLSAINKKGYDKCQPEDGPRLRELYQGRDSLLIAMEPIAGHIFYLNYEKCWHIDEKPTLRTSCYREYFGYDRFVFRRRKAS